MRFLLGLILSACIAAAAPARAAEPVRVVIVGLVHGHVKGFLRNFPQSKDATLVGIVEPDAALAAQYEKQYALGHALFHTDLEETLRSTHPDAVLVYTTILDHRRVIETAARMGISSMVEKPLSTTVEDAIAIRDAARGHHVHVLVNYETTWYGSNAEALQMASHGDLGEIRKCRTDTRGQLRLGLGRSGFPGSRIQNAMGPAPCLILAATARTLSRSRCMARDLSALRPFRRLTSRKSTRTSRTIRR